ncbi:winged helix DNA-binding domain-containing protein [Actinomadura alba]|uniref:Winged helix DNA-binding domain-containing protein n=1 Tax=Actinomadura alba TaxID=406431 RepID=A0ABR7M1Q1_9ACTN|nr:winged helix DNA-binding domain-containing protein [Actinomadura alba]
MLDVDRGRVLAYRVMAHGLEREAGDVADLAVLDLGVQDTPSGSARLALAARSATPPAGDPEGLALVWTFRGAPHLHRIADLPGLSTALWPLSDADATARIATTSIKEGARLGLAAFTAAAEAMRAVVTAPRPRGEVSTEVTARIPASLTYDCASCGARHVSGALFQQVGLPAGVLVRPGTSPAVLAPIEGRPGVPRRAEGTAALAEAYLRLHGPATPAEVASFIGTTQRDLVRLLPPSDPFLQARDRALLVPDKARHAKVWKMIAKPGALLVDGEIEGVWRARKAGRARLEITVTPFQPLPARVRDAVLDEAGRVAAVRGATDVRVLYDG